MFVKHPFPSLPEVDVPIAAEIRNIEYNDDGWHNPAGQLFRRLDDEQSAPLRMLL
jgi:hypothetical protein